jgi:hypothetical protein
MENVPPTVVSQLSAKSEARASARASHGDPATDHRVGYASNSVGRSRTCVCVVINSQFQVSSFKFH